MTPSRDTIKRIIKDHKDLINNPLNDHGIYVKLNEENIFQLKVMMIGPKNTPYYQGYYFFYIDLPYDYPFNPPIVTFKTNNGRIRFNPNLYINGKVCLSILNTWSGPAWTACQTLRSILLSIMGLVLVDHPLFNEPGYEDDYNNSNKYNKILNHECLRFCMLKMLDKPITGFEYFKTIMDNNFKINFFDILKHINDIKHEDMKLYFGPYNLHIKTDYEELYHKTVKIYNKLNGEYMFEDIKKLKMKEIQRRCKLFNISLKEKSKRKRKYELYRDLEHFVMCNFDNIIY